MSNTETWWDRVKDEAVATVTPEELKEIAPPLEEEKQPLVVIGGSGHGKTEGLEQANAEMRKVNYGYEEPAVDCMVDRPRKGQHGYINFNSSSREPEDMALPNFGDLQRYESTVTTALPGADDSWYPDKGMTEDDLYVTVNVEEIAKNVNNYKVWAQLFNERSLGTNYRVPKHTWFTATGNRSSDNAGAHDLFSDLVSRSTIVYCKSTVEAFLNYHRGELHPLIETIVKYQGDQFLFTQEDEASGKAFASPRTVAKASRFLNNGMDLSNKIAYPIMLGTIGLKATTELMATWRAYERLGDIDEMLNDPVAHKDKIDQLRSDNSHNGRQTLCSVIAMLGKRVKKDATQFNRLIKFVNRIDEEAAVTFVNCALQANDKVRKESEFVKHYADNQMFYF